MGPLVPQFFFFVEMKHRKFRDLSNNRVVEVTDLFEDIVILDGKSKIKKNQLLDKRMFEEYVDPNSFFRNESLLNTFAEQIKKIPLDDWDSRVKSDETGFNEPINESAVLPYDPEIEKEELLRKAKTLYNPSATNDLVRSQFDKLKDIMEDDDMQINEIPPIPQPNPNPTIQVESKQLKPMDPILEMFKNVKRNTSFKIDFTVENKIPRVDFIEMMEDSYNTSIIDFLAQEFTDEIVRDPSIIKDKIKQKLTDLVYPEVESKTK